MTAYEGLTIFLLTLAVAWAFVLAFTITDVLIPYAIERCRRRHPGSRA